MSTQKKRYAIVGLGGRSRMFSEAILKTYNETSELVGLCDVNQTRMDYHNRTFQEDFSAPAVPTYKAEDFVTMLKEQKVDVAIVTTMDRTHHKYIVAAMETRCDVISEK